MKFKLTFFSKNKKYRIKKNAFLVMMLVSIFLGCLVAEVMIRKLTNFPEVNEYGNFRHLAGLSIPKKSIDQELFWTQYRQFGGGQHTKNKEQGVFRIICIGDSVTQGYIHRGTILRENAHPFS